MLATQHFIFGKLSAQTVCQATCEKNFSPLHVLVAFLGEYDGLTRDGCRRILERFYGFYASLEPAIWAVAGRDGERRRRDRGGDGHHRPQT